MRRPGIGRPTSREAQTQKGHGTAVEPMTELDPKTGTVGVKINVAKE